MTPKTVFAGKTPKTFFVGRHEDALRIHSGQANKESPHLIVPLYMPLALPLSLEEGFRCVSPDIQKAVVEDRARLLAIAHGEMVEPGAKPETVQFILLHGVLSKGDEPMHYVFDTRDGEAEVAVLMNGDGTRHLEEQPLTQEEAVALWMGGFVGWSEKVPGLYRLRYALIAPKA